MDNYHELQCHQCGYAEQCSPDEILTRLHGIGMLRREKEPADELVWELFRTAARSFACPQCGVTGLGVVAVEDFDSGLLATRRCERCSQVIPAERVELFPDSRLCISCQQKQEAGDTGADVEYCERCGGVMEIRSTQAGIRRYRMVCSECGR